MPRSPTPAEPTIPRHSRGIVVAAPALPTAKASALDEFRGSITRLQHPLPTLHEWCCHHPCKACFRLAGSPLPGESRTLWIATKGFRSSSSSSGLGLAQGKFHFGTSLHIIRSRHRRVAVERRIHCDLGAIIAGAVQSFGRISTTNTRSGTFVLFCAVCARFPVSK